MKRRLGLPGLVATGLAVTALAAGVTVAVAGGAAASTLSVLTVKPIEPKVADVCWTRFEPDIGAVTMYRLTAPEVQSLPSTLDPNTDPPNPDGLYCSRFSTLLPGKRYTFSLDAQVDGGAYEPAAADLVARAYQLSAELSRSQAKAGQQVTVSGILKSGNPVAGGTVIVQQRVKPSEDWTKLGQVTTNPQGGYAKAFTVTRNVNIRTYFKGIADGPSTAGAWNSDNPIDVSPVFRMSFSKNPTQVGNPVRARGVVIKGNVALLAGDNVCLQVRHDGSWRGLACVPISNEGKFHYALTPKSRKDLNYRWRATSMAPEYVSGNSKKLLLLVR